MYPRNFLRFAVYSLLMGTAMLTFFVLCAWLLAQRNVGDVATIVSLKRIFAYLLLLWNAVLVVFSVHSMVQARIVRDNHAEHAKHRTFLLISLVLFTVLLPTWVLLFWS